VLIAVPGTCAPYPAIDVDKEVAAIQRALSPMGKEVDLTILGAHVTLERIGHAFIDRPFHVLHFIGHAEFRDNQGHLLLNDEQGGPEWIDEHRFAGILKNQGDLKLVVLNACQGATVSGTQVFSGIAPNLVREGIPAVVAMQYPVFDTAAILFAREFYYALFRGANAGRVDWAMVHARNALMRDFPGQREVAAPVLYLRAPHGVLFYKYTGSRVLDAAYSKAARDTERAVEATHRFNQSLSDDLTAMEAPGLSEQLSQDRRDYAWLKKRIAFRNRLVMVSAVTSVVVFMIFWVGLLDVMRFDAMLEGFTLASVNALTQQRKESDVVIVTIEHEVNPTWRSKYADLVRRLAQAGARVVVFDMTFEHDDTQPARGLISRATEDFAAAIEMARHSGTKVVLGFEALSEETPRIEESLHRAIGFKELGAVCLSGKRGRVGVAPLVIQKTGSDDEQAKIYPSLSLAAFIALKNGRDLSVDWQARRIRFTPFDIGSIEFSERRTATGGRCPVNQPNDQNADLVIDLTPVDVIRDDRHTIDYDRLVSMADRSGDRSLFGGKVVFVGVRTAKESFPVFDFDHGYRYGVELHADAFRTINDSSEGAIVVRPLSAGRQSFFLVALIVLGVSIRFWIKPESSRLRVSLLIAFAIAYAAIAFTLSVRHRVLMDWFYHLVGFFIAYFISGRVEKRWYR
jgi:hypothetical protein